MRLVFTADGADVVVKTVVPTYRGEDVTILSIEKPHWPSSHGRVKILDHKNVERDVYPRVIKANWANRGDQFKL